MKSHSRTDVIHRYTREEERFESVSDAVTIEEPLEIRVDGHSVAVVMRTPGDDEELTRGFLLTEEIIQNEGDLFELSQCPSQEQDGQMGNVIDVLLAHPDRVDLTQLSRHVFSSSSCGLCGRATLEKLFQNHAPIESSLRITPEILHSLPERLREAQRTFARTGGLHASALFDASGRLEVLREDVGRHNALDKVIGWAMKEGRLPLNDQILLVSGRLSFELAQKALCAGIPMIAGISAPSSLAIDCALKGGITLVGFLRDKGFNLYTHPKRIALPSGN